MPSTPQWDSSICLRCAACIGTCPSHAMKLRNPGVVIDPSSCVSCWTCVKICPVGALKEAGRDDP